MAQATGGGGGGGGYRNSDAFQGAGGSGGSGVAIVQYSMGFVPGVLFEVAGSAVTAANEGSTVVVVFIGAAETGAVPYTITGISTADISGAGLTGTVNLVNYEASITLVITEDVSIGEGVETMTVSFVENSVTYQADLIINDTSSALTVTAAAVPGDTITVTLNTSSMSSAGSGVTP